ncbi:MAG: serine/threonine protein kinase [Oscillospiraceae bacterium]|nr:serine/threonine protein kinase [Oscillospiraceae bacterium]
MLKIGSLVDGKYKILSEIGRGGMSVVYMAINEKANKTWAVKEVRKDGRMDFNIVRQGLLAEIDTLKRLSHPNLPSIVDLIEDENSFIIVMDYIEGRSLDKIIAEAGVQDEALVVEWAKQLCDVLGYLHSQNPPIIYRDMKPANVMLKPNGSIMVIDFGTAKNYEIEYGETTGIGTVGYAAPEQYIGSGLGRTDARTDIYCLGITLYYLLTNIDPCKNLISDKSVRAINPALSHGLDAIIKKCTEFQPADRYQSCAELMYDLENYNALEPLHKKKQKKKLSLFFAATLLSALFAVGGVVLGASANAKASDNYEQKLYEASKTADYSEKVALYEECIAIPNKAGQTDAYLELIRAFKENDALFTVEEAGLLEKLIKNNKAELQADPAAYTELCFETGKLFWYYYNYGDSSSNQLTRAKSAISWFQDVLDNAPENYENLGMARVYANIGIFYRDITTNITEASDKGQYAPLFANLQELLSTASADETEKEIVRLEMLEMARSALQQYATKFKLDGLSYEELSGMHRSISDIVETIGTTADTTEEKKNHTLSLLPDTLKAIDTAYGSKNGGEGQ